MLPENKIPGLIVADEARVAELAAKLGLRPKYPFPERIEPISLDADTDAASGAIEEGGEAAKLGIKF